MYWVDILNGPARGRRKIQRRVCAVGSDLSCQLWIDAEGVAARHAELVERDGGVVLKPLMPGRIAINGRPVVAPVVLNDGDTVEIGGVRFRYRARLPFAIRAGPTLKMTAVLIVLLTPGAFFLVRRLSSLRITRAPAPDVRQFELPKGPIVREPEPLKRMEELGAAAIAAARAPPALAPPAIEPPVPPPANPPAVPSGAPLPSAPPVAVASPTTSTPVSGLATLTTPPVPLPAAPPVQSASPTTQEAPAVASAPIASAFPAEPPPAVVVSAFTTEVAAAEALLAAGRIEPAASRVATVPAGDPLYPRALAIRARAAEHAGRIREAEKLWSEVLKQPVGSPLHETAFQELIRLAELQVQLAPPPLLDRALRTATATPPSLVQPPPLPTPIASRPPPAPTVSGPTSAPPIAAATPPPPAMPAGPASALRPSSRPTPEEPGRHAAPPPPVQSPPQSSIPASQRPAPSEAAELQPTFRCASTRMRRFQGDDHNEELRVIEAEVQLDPSSPPVACERLVLEVTFYDRTDAGRIVPTRSARGGGRFLVPPNPSPRWTPGETRTFSFSYAVPRGARETEAQQHGAPASFFGYRLRVFADGRPAGEYAKPSDLPR